MFFSTVVTGHTRSPFLEDPLVVTWSCQTRKVWSHSIHCAC